MANLLKKYSNENLEVKNNTNLIIDDQLFDLMDEDIKSKVATLESLNVISGILDTNERILDSDTSSEVKSVIANQTLTIMSNHGFDVVSLEGSDKDISFIKYGIKRFFKAIYEMVLDLINAIYKTIKNFIDKMVLKIQENINRSNNALYEMKKLRDNKPKSSTINLEQDGKVLSVNDETPSSFQDILESMSLLKDVSDGYFSNYDTDIEKGIGELENNVKRFKVNNSLQSLRDTIDLAMKYQGGGAYVYLAHSDLDSDLANGKEYVYRSKPLPGSKILTFYKPNLDNYGDDDLARSVELRKSEGRLEDISDKNPPSGGVIDNISLNDMVKINIMVKDINGRVLKDHLKNKKTLDKEIRSLSKAISKMKSEAESSDSIDDGVREHYREIMNHVVSFTKWSVTPQSSIVKLLVQTSTSVNNICEKTVDNFRVESEA